MKKIKEFLQDNKKNNNISICWKCNIISILLNFLF